jgi:hypothetical protein
MALTHSPKIITNGLFFSLDSSNIKSYSGSGTSTTDMMTYNRTGTLYNGVNFSDRSFVFDGTNDYIQFANIFSIAPTYTGTIEFIAKGTGSLLSNERTSSSHGFGGVSITAGGALEIWSVTTYSFPYGYSLTTTNTASTSQYNYYAVKATIPNGGTMSGSLMINGQIESKSVSISGGAPAAYYSLDVGRSRNENYGTTYFTGNVVMLRLYNRLLSDQELMYNYYSSAGRLRR